MSSRYRRYMRNRRFNFIMIYWEKLHIRMYYADEIWQANVLSLFICWCTSNVYWRRWNKISKDLFQFHLKLSSIRLIFWIYWNVLIYSCWRILDLKLNSLTYYGDQDFIERVIYVFPKHFKIRYFMRISHRVKIWWKSQHNYKIYVN